MLSTWAAREPAVGHVHAHLHDVISGRPVQQARGKGAGEAWKAQLETPCPYSRHAPPLRIERLARAVHVL